MEEEELFLYQKMMGKLIKKKESTSKRKIKKKIKTKKKK